MMLRRFAAPAAALALAATLAACGSDHSMSADTTPAAPAAPASDTSGAAVVLNEADIEFAQGMIAHHEQAIEMAEIALDPTVGAGPAVVELAARVQGGQDPEIDLMTEWLTAWEQPVQMDMSDGHSMEDMEGMMSAEQMDALAAATGAEFDQLWLEMMIEHHTGAISMADTVKADGSNPDVRVLADQIITAQQAEIEEMQQLLAG